MSSVSSELIILDDICDRFETELRSGTEINSIQQFVIESLDLNAQQHKKLVENLLQIEWDFLLEKSVSPNLDSYKELNLLAPADLRKVFLKWQQARSQTQLFENYQLIKQLGQGRFGAVWQAIDLDSRKPVAIKIAHPSLIENPDQFFRESKAALNLRHPNIANVIKSGEWKSRPFIVREYVAGKTLSQLLRDESLSPSAAAQLVLRLARTLAYSHSAGCIHRDLKPGNILIQDDGKPVLIDFGLAKTIGNSTEGTASGIVMGTPVYMAPEQARGNSKSVDARSDIYSLGVVLFEALTGRRPFEGGFEETLYQVLKKEPQSPRILNKKIPTSLSNICLKCLRKEPQDRYQSAEELAVDLQRYLDGESVAAAPDGQLKRVWRFAKANPAIAALAACSFLLLVSLALVSLNSERNMRSLWQRETHLRAEAEESRRIAEQNAEQATLESALSQQITVFLNNVFVNADPLSTYILGSSGNGNPEMTASDILEQAAARIEAELEGRARLQARLLAIIGGVNCNLGRIQPARELLEKARTLVRHLQSEYPEKDFRRDEAILRLNEGRLFHYVGEYSKASDCFYKSLELHQQILPIDEERIAEILLQAGWLHIECRQPRLALSCFDRLLKLNTPQLKKDSNLMWAVKLAEAHCRKQNLRFALLACQAYLSIKDRKLAGLAVKVVGAQLAKELNWYEVALPLHRQVIKEMETRFSNNSRWILLAKGDYASTLFKAGFHAEALQTIEPLMQYGKKIAPKHPHIKSFYNTIGMQKLLAEQHDQAVDYLAAAQDNPLFSAGFNFEQKLWLTEALIGNGDFERAKSLLPAIEDFPDRKDQGSRIEEHVWFHLLSAKISLGLQDEKSFRHHVLEAKKKAGPHISSYIPSSIIYRHAWLHQQLGDNEKVHDLLQLALRKDIARFPPKHPRIAESHFRLGEFLLSVDQTENARSHLKKSLRIRESRLPKADPRIEKTRKLLDSIGQRKHR